MEQKRHPFSFTLGPGPYRFVDFFALVIPSEANQGRNNFHLAPKNLKSGCGTCAHCGHGIINNYIVQNGIGERFAVGSECIEKCGSSGEFQNLSQVEKRVKEEKRRKGQEQRESRRIKQAAEIKALIDSNSVTLKTKPHPSKFHPTKTAYDYCIFCYRNGHITLGAIKFLKSKLMEWGIA